MTRYIFITGGVASSLGKGIASAALGTLLQSRGYSVKLRKLDPYLNVDPGTMSPYQHGEVFVTEDGTETDLDLGHYERFTDVNSSVQDNITTGQIYNKVIERERSGDYLGGTVQIIPHVTDQIKEFIVNNNKNVDFCLCEIGGTVGDIEGLPFFEAIRQLGNELPSSKTCFVHLTLVPYISAAGEIKTKPTQHSVKELRSIGIQPDVLVCRSEKKIDRSDIKKIAIFCNVSEESVIQATDVSTIYATPKIYMKNGFDTQVLKSMNINKPSKINLRKWNKVVDSINNPQDEVNIAVVGKYIGLKDAYNSLTEALTHGGIANDVRVNMHRIDAENIKGNSNIKKIKAMSGILVTVDVSKRVGEGKIIEINDDRIVKMTYLDIC